jgi:hypothetical protein
MVSSDLAALLTFSVPRERAARHAVRSSAYRDADDPQTCRDHRGTLGKLDAQDPVVAIETQADNLRRLKALYIDCGKNDQFNLL